MPAARLPAYPYGHWRHTMRGKIGEPLIVSVFGPPPAPDDAVPEVDAAPTADVDGAFFAPGGP